MSPKAIGWVLIILVVASLFIGLSYFFLVGYLLDPKGASDKGENLGWAFTLPGVLSLAAGWWVLKRKK